MARKPGVYTKVTDFREWIFKAIKVSCYGGGLSGTLVRKKKEGTPENRWIPIGFWG